MKTNYSSGPWASYINRNSSSGCPIIGSSSGDIVCVIANSINNNDDVEKAISDTNLIVKAPELFESLIEIIKISDRNHDAYNNAKNLIKQITGLSYEELIKT